MSKRVLVVDDEAELRQILAEFLPTIYPCAVTQAGSGEEALALLEAGAVQPELMITDFGMPGMNGFELTQRAKGLLPDLRVVVVTGDERGERMRVAACYAGADEVLGKPFDLQAIGLVALRHLHG